MTSSDISLRIVKRAVVAGVEHNHPRVAAAFHYVFKKYVRSGKFQRIGNCIGGERGIGNYASRQAICGIHRLTEKVISISAARVVFICLGDHTLQKINVLVKIRGDLGLIDILRVICPVFAENEEIDVIPRHFAEKVPFHLTLFAEIEETAVRRSVERIREIFPEDHGLLPPYRQTVGVISVPREICDVVERIVLPVGFHHLAEIFFQNLIFVVLHRSGNLHPRRIDVGAQMLCALLRKAVVEHVGIHCVAADVVEAEVEIVVETV